MTSGKHLTERDVHSILRLAGYKATNGDWLLSYDQIADQLRLDPRTVRDHVRKAAVNWGVLTQWRPDPESD